MISIRPGDQIEGRRLAAAGRPDQRDELAVLDLERDAIDGDHIAVHLHDFAQRHTRHGFSSFHRRFAGGVSDGHGATLRGIVDQRGEPFSLRLVLLRADHPPDSGFAIGGGLGLKKVPGRGVGLKLRLRSRIERDRALLLVRIDRAPILAPGREGGDAGGVHQAVLL